MDKTATKTLTTRDCRDCQQCCIIYEIEGIKKKARENCPFLNPGVGCTDYGHRPVDCKKFECTWKKGFGNDEDNPKICGVLIMNRQSNLMHNGSRMTYIASEIYEDAFKSENGLAAMARVSEETNSTIIMMDYDNQKIISLCKGDGVV